MGDYVGTIAVGIGLWRAWHGDFLPLGLFVAGYLACGLEVR